MNVFTANDLEAAGLLARDDGGGAPLAVTPPPASDGQGRHAIRRASTGQVTASQAEMIAATPRRACQQPAGVPVTVDRAAARDGVFDGDPQVGDQDTEAVEGLVERLAAWCPLRMCPGSNPVTPASCATRHLGPGAGERGVTGTSARPGICWDHLRERASNGRIPRGADHGARA